MNRLTTVLYPSVPGSGSEGSSIIPTPQDARTTSPSTAAAPADHPQYPLPMNFQSIYDDPRSTTFGSPDRDILDRAPISAVTYASVASTSSSASGSGPTRPHLLRQLTDDGIKASRRSASPSPSRRRTDRGLRVNLMQQAKAKGGRTPAPGCGGRLTSMAKGPNGRYVVGGGQYLRVVEIANGNEDGRRTPDGARTPIPPKSPGRQAGPPFARGSGGTTIAEVVNFWKGSWPVGKGVNDVDWGTANFETKIVTATPSGSFMIFDINRGKMERETSGGHPRPINCIRFSKVQNSAYLLLTGGTEGQVRLWDMRDPEPTSRKFYKHNAPVTALALSPDDPHSFVVGTEAGGLFRYDYRVQNKTVGKVWGAHGSKPVMDLKWKPPTEEYGPISPGKGWLASAGGDRTVQIWDMSQTWDKVATPTHILHTAHPARYIDWRPNHPTELIVVPFDILSATAQDPARPEPIPDESDCSLEVWDVRRHHVAKYALPGLEGNAVAALWDDADTLVACYQNGGFVQRDLNSKIMPRTHPLEGIPRQVAAWSAKGELAYAIDRFKHGEIPFDDVKPEFASWQVGGHRHRKSVADPAYEPQQSLGVVPLADHDEAEFMYMAHQYRLEGDTPTQLCRWNREVAEICGRLDEARIWDHLQGLMEEFGAIPEGLFNEGVFSQAVATTTPVARVPSPRGEEGQTSPLPYNGPRGIPLERAESLVAEDQYDLEDDSESHSSGSSTESSTGPETPPRRSRFKSFMPPSINPPSAMRQASLNRPDLSSAATNNRNSYIGRQKRLTMLDTPMPEDTPTPVADMDYPDPYGIAAALEAVAPQGSRGGLTSRSTPQGSTGPPTPAMLDRKVLVGSAHASPVGSQRPSIVAANKDNRIQPAAITRRAQETFQTEEWEKYRLSRCKVFLSWWRSYIDDGEVQVATALYVVGADVVPFPKKQAEHVVEAYIDLLERHHLDIPVAYLRRYANILDLETTPGQDGITHILHCSRCGKSTGSLEDSPDRKTFWWCTKCRRAANICVVCREPVKGLWMGCNKCRHGGHQRCMRLYYLETEKTVAQPSAAPSRAPSPPGVARRQSSGPTPAPGSGSGSGPAAQGEASLDSGFTERTEKDTDPNGGGGREVLVATNTCPSGCGCRCRVFGGALPHGH